MSMILRTVGVVVKDMAKSLEFYRILGLPIPPAAANEANVEIKANDEIVLGFLTESMARQADPKFVTPVGQNMNLQFECDSPQQVDAAYTEVIGAGFASYAAPWDAFWGQRFARVVDPDGRIVNLYAEL